MMYSPPAKRVSKASSGIQDHFITQSRKILKVVTNESQARLPETIRDTLDALLELQYPIKDVSEQIFIDSIIAGCKAISTFLHVDCQKFCQHIFNVLKKQQVRTAHLRQQGSEIIILYLLRVVEETESSEVRVDALRALSVVVYEKGANTERVCDQLFKVLFRFSDCDQRPMEVRRMAINCLGNVSIGMGIKLDPWRKQIYKILFSNIGSPLKSRRTLDLSDPALRKIASSTLRSLQLVLNEDASTRLDPDLVDIIHTFVFYGVNTFSHPHRRASFQSSMVVNRSLPLGLPVYNGVSKKSNVTSSDSEMSDGEHTYSQKRSRDEARIRVNALGCLQTIAKMAPKAFYTYWTRFLPDSSAHDRPVSLFTILIEDPTDNVRISACNALIAILDGSKQYLSVAVDRDVKSSFTSLSDKMATLAHELHTGLATSIRKETQFHVLVQLFKCSRRLVENCSYDRLSSGYLSFLYTSACFQLRNVTPTVIIASLDSISAIVDARSAQSEVTHLITTEKIQTSLDTKTLIPYLFDLLPKEDCPTDVRIEAWNVLCACTRSQFEIIRKEWSHIEEMLKKVYTEKDESIRSAAARFLEGYSKAVGEAANEEREMKLEWWNSALARYIFQFSRDTCEAVRALSCDCLSNMPQEVYVEFPKKDQILCVTLLLGLVSDDNVDVRAAACRSLGVFILFPDLMEDSLFLADTATAFIQQFNDRNLLLRMRASWALANLCDALAAGSLQAKNSLTMTECLSTELWIQIVQSGIAVSNDNDKLRSNGVRALGSIISVSPEEYLCIGQGSLLKDVVTILAKNIEAGSLKVRWNACHATVNLLSNPFVPVGQADWTGTLYNSLIKSVQQCKNFKVRINASAALATPNLREKYGGDEIFNRIVDTVVKALENVGEMGEETNFAEFKYKEQLCQQLIDTFNHLERLMTSKDRAQLASLLAIAQKIISVNSAESVQSVITNFVTMSGN